jgi:FkbH-like protein
MHPTAPADLAARLASAHDRAAPSETASLIALAVLDPAAAVEWLREQHRNGAAVPRARLTRLLAVVAESITAIPGLVPRDAVLDLIEHYGHLLAPDAARELAAAARFDAVDAELTRALTSALDRAPYNPGLLRPAAELAAASGEHTRAHDLLSRLGRADPALATMQFIYGARGRLARTQHTPVRIALLSSFTIDPLVPFVDLECRALRLEPEIHVAPFNTWEREMLGDGSGAQRFAPQIAFLSVAADDLLPELATSGGADLASAGAAAVDRLLEAAARFTAWSSAVLVVHGLHSAFRDPVGPAGARVGPSRSEVLASLNARLAEGLRALPRAYWLDMADVLARRRQGTLDNPKMRHLASMRLGEHVLGDVAAAYMQYVAPVTGRTRKCIVLDLDNTLWGGIVGEDGPHGIRLGTTSPGSEYREFQEYLLSLTRRGILLAINSKNNAADALEVIRSHEAMVLREESFSAMRINWESKASNMLSLAEELSLGLDSFVFIDDSDKERALIRQALPQVLTPELPRDPARYRETLEALPELQVLSITDEDRNRTRQYVERRQREQLRVVAQTPEDYLASLGITAEMHTVSERTLTRVQQLFQRTNQFNLTGRRYELGVLAARAEQPDWRIYTSKVADRFGDHGLVAATLVRITPDAWIIDNFVMSCRVIGYGVEDALLARVAADARDQGVFLIEGEIIPSAKNAPARDFYARNDFLRDPDAGERERWRRDLRDAVIASPRWIRTESTRDT